MKRALLVDDSPIVRAAVKQVLVPMGFECIEAEDGFEALDLLAKGAVPDLAFVDVNMPKMNGIEFVSAVAKEKKWAQMALIMLTTEVNASLKEDAKKAGVKVWLLKPIVADRLKKAVELVVKG